MKLYSVLGVLSACRIKQNEDTWREWESQSYMLVTCTSPTGYLNKGLKEVREWPISMVGGKALQVQGTANANTLRQLHPGVLNFFFHLESLLGVLHHSGLWSKYYILAKSTGVTGISQILKSPRVPRHCGSACFLSILLCSQEIRFMT